MIIGMSETLTPAKGEICENLWELPLYRTHVNYDTKQQKNKCFKTYKIKYMEYN